MSNKNDREANDEKGLPGKDFVTKGLNAEMTLGETPPATTYSTAKDVVADTIDSIEKRYRSNMRSIETLAELKEMDDIFVGFHDAKFIVVESSHPQYLSALTNMMTLNIVAKSNISVGFFSIGSTKEVFVSKLISIESMISREKLDGGMLNVSDFKNLTNAANVLYEAPLYICDTPDIALDDLRKEAVQMVEREGVKIIFIDNLSLITFGTQKEKSEEERFAEISGELKNLAFKLGIPIIGYVHKDS